MSCHISAIAAFSITRVEKQDKSYTTENASHTCTVTLSWRLGFASVVRQSMKTSKSVIM